jgi:hypothetical protein
MSAPGEYDDKDVTPNRPDRASSTPAGGGEYDDKDVSGDKGSTAPAEPESEPEGSFVDKDVEPRAATERGKGEYDDKDR